MITPEGGSPKQRATKFDRPVVVEDAPDVPDVPEETPDPEVPAPAPEESKSTPEPEVPVGASEPEVPVGAPEPEVPVAAPRNVADVRVPRREARTKALELLFAADVRDTAAVILLAQGTPVDVFTELLVDTVTEHRLELDELISAQAEGWTIDRMPVVDRNLLRLGLAELLHLDEVPAKVAIDEAVELAKALSTDASPKFVNGVLAAVARDRGLV